MINNPGAIEGRSTLPPLTQQVPTAELDNSVTRTGALEALVINVALLFIPAGPIFLSYFYFIWHYFRCFTAVSCLLTVAVTILYPSQILKFLLTAVL
jgi:hypothetical protein